MKITRNDIENIDTKEKLLSFLNKALTDTTFKMQAKAEANKIGNQEVLTGNFLIMLEIQNNSLILVP